MSEAYRCDITGVCIAAGESPNTSWTVDSGVTTILGLAGVGIAMELKVTVPGVTGKAHISQAARDAVMARVKTYVNANW